MRHAPRTLLGAALQGALPFVLAVAVGAAVTLAIRAALQDPSTAADPHAAHAGHAAHATEPAPAPDGGTETAAGHGLLVDLGNTACPIMGGDVSGKDFTEWRGLRVAHCCPPCKAKFLAAPEQHLDEAGIDWRPLVARIEAAEAAEGAERERLLAELRKDHTIVREPEPR